VDAPDGLAQRLAMRRQHARSGDRHGAAAAPFLASPGGLDELARRLRLLAEELGVVGEHGAAAVALGQLRVGARLVTADEPEDDAEAAVLGRVVEGRVDRTLVE
jgi:hypothetical protein